MGKYNFDYLRERVGNFAREDIVPAFLSVEKVIDELWATPGTIDGREVKERLDELLEGVMRVRTLAMEELGRARTTLSGNE